MARPLEICSSAPAGCTSAGEILLAVASRGRPPEALLDLLDAS